MEIRTSRNRDVVSSKMSPEKVRERRKAVRRQERHPSARSRMAAGARIVGRVGIFMLVVTFMLSAVIFAFRSETFNLRDVRVVGCRHQDAEKLKEIVYTEFPANTLRINLAEVRQRLEKEPWVKRAALQRVLPSMLILHVTERTPTAIVELKGEQMVADGYGILLGAYDSGFRKLNSPIFKGFLGADPETYQMYQEENTNRIERGLAMLTEVAAASPEIVRKISEVDLSDHNNMKILMDDDTVEICLGGEDYSKRIRNFVNDPEKRYQELKSRGFEVEQIDLRSKGEIIYRLKQPGRRRQDHRT